MSPTPSSSYTLVLHSNTMQWMRMCVLLCVWLCFVEPLVGDMGFFGNQDKIKTTHLDICMTHTNIKRSLCSWRGAAWCHRHCWGVTRGGWRSGRRGTLPQKVLNFFSREGVDFFLLCFSFPLLFPQLIHTLQFFCTLCCVSLGCCGTI